MYSTSKRPGGFPGAPRWFRGNARRSRRATGGEPFDTISYDPAIQMLLR